MNCSILLSVGSCFTWTALAVFATAGLCILGRKIICDYYGLRFIPSEVTLIFAVLTVLLSFNYIMIAKNNIAIQAAEATHSVADIALAVGGDYLREDIREKAEYVKGSAQTEAEKGRKEAQTLIWIFAGLSVAEAAGALALARMACRKAQPRRRGVRSVAHGRRRQSRR